MADIKILDKDLLSQLWTKCINTFQQSGNVPYSFIASEYEKTLNLFNPKATSYGAIYSASGVTSGDTSCRHSDYIEIEPSTTYKNNMVGSWSSGSGLAFYNSSKTYISGISSSNSNYTQFTTPSNAKYVRISYYIESGTYYTNESTLMLVKGTTLPSSYIAYGGGKLLHQDDIEPDLLWANGNPYTSYTDTTITIPVLSNYKYLIFGFMINTSTSQTTHYQVVENKSGRYVYLGLIDNTSSSLYHRGVQIVNTTQINFFHGYINSTQNDTCCIPVSVYGKNTL